MPQIGLSQSVFGANVKKPPGTLVMPIFFLAIFPLQSATVALKNRTTTGSRPWLTIHLSIPFAWKIAYYRITLIHHRCTFSVLATLQHSWRKGQGGGAPGRTDSWWCDRNCCDPYPAAKWSLGNLHHILHLHLVISYYRNSRLLFTIFGPDSCIT